MNSMNFVKGMGIGLVVGSAIGVAVATPPKKMASGKSRVGKTLRAVGEVIENIGNSVGL